MMQMDTRLYTKAIRNLVGEVPFTLAGTDFNSLDFFGAEVTITEDAVLSEYNSVVYENSLEQVREKRNELLAETDWWANSDVTMTDEQRAYRQALRDVPAQAGFPENVTWPTKPE